MMTLPGLALFYAGMVRKKNVLATMAQSLMATALVSLLWFGIGYSLSFRGDGAWIGDFVRPVPERHRPRHDQPAGQDHSRTVVLHLPDDIRHHHGGADRRRRRRTG